MSDPYAAFAQPVQETDPYASIAAPVEGAQPSSELHTYQTRDPKGKIVSFQAPADADDATVRQMAAKAVGGDKRYLRSIVKRDGSKVPGNDTSAATGFVGGVLKPIDNAALAFTANPVGRAVDQFGQALGFPGAEQGAQQHRDMRDNNTRTGYQTLGNIAGTLPLARLPGGLATQGAAGGALLSESDNPLGVAMDAGLGAAGSLVGGGLVKGLGALAGGVTDKGLKALNAAGIPLTLGQIAAAGSGAISKGVAKAEEALTSVPWLGDLVNVARDRGLKAFNVAIGNRILGNVGETLPKGATAGHEMVEAVQSKLSDRYKALVPGLRGTADTQFNSDLAAAEAIADNAGRKDQLVGVVTRLFKNRFQGQTISGQMLKDAETELTKLQKTYKPKGGDEGLYGEALDGVRQALRGLVMRSNPAQAEELQALNTGWAQLKDVRKAIAAGSEYAQSTGEFSTGKLLKQSAGKGYRDPLAEAASQVLPNRTPDSGTARRAMYGLGTIAAGGGAAGLGLSPALAAPAAGSLLYTQTGQKALNALAFGNRPALVSGAAKPLKELSRYAPQLVTGGIAAQKK